jgi:hypothetical protein
MRLSRRRRVLLVYLLAFCLAACSFSLGAWYSQRRLEKRIAAAIDAQNAMATEITHNLSTEMGLMPISMLRDRRKSFVEVNAYDEFGAMRYSTAGYLGNGYFITVKHGVMPLNDNQQRTASVKYEFADPIVRLGNDYSKGIILSTGYIGQRTANGLLTSLTDGHPGVSGGGVLNRSGNLIGIPIGRMEADYRFSFILPLREEMFRKVPSLSAGAKMVATAGMGGS